MRNWYVMLVMAMMYGLHVSAQVKVNTQSLKGDIKIMNAVNNGPYTAGVDQINQNFETYKACAFPYARTHDSSFSAGYGGEHSVDISAVFPDFDKDANEPSSYDFALTDVYLKQIQDAGTKVFYRLGQKIEHASKKYGIYPPKDYRKWAVIAEHIIRHYTEGWNKGFKWDIAYWEIWNEPDLDDGHDYWKVNPRTWGGSKEEFFKFYRTVADHLNSCFPDLKIGGPAYAHHDNGQWLDDFLAYMRKYNVAIDFVSWHYYGANPYEASARAEHMRQIMDKNGYEDAESILNEWNYNRGWTNEYPYSLRKISDEKGAAFCAAVMAECQKSSASMLMYYDARQSAFNGLFDFYDFHTKPAYYCFYAWSKMLRLGKEADVKLETEEKDIHAVAASDGKGRYGIFLSRFTDNDNIVAPKYVWVRMEGLPDGYEIVGHITDSSRMYTEIPLSSDGNEIRVLLEPNSIIYIEARP